MKRTAFLALALLLVAVTVVSCGGGTAGKSITVGSKEFTEQIILGKMMKFMLEDAGWSVDDKTGLGGTMICREALESGDIHVYMEYTGTGLLVHLGHEDPITDPQVCYETVRDEDLSENGIVWFEPSLFDNTYTLMMRQADADSLGIESISDLADYINASPGELTFASGAQSFARRRGPGARSPTSHRPSPGPCAWPSRPAWRCGWRAGDQGPS